MARFTLILVGLFLFGASLLAVLGYALPKQPREFLFSPTEAKRTQCMVITVYDGDTFGCDMDGDGKVTRQGEHVRMLGIDAPEMHYSRKNKTGHDEPGAREAVNFVETAVLDKPVYLEFDQDHYDQYQRTLAYVYLDARGQRMLNRLLLEKGLAKVLFLGKNRRYQRELSRAATK